MVQGTCTVEGCERPSRYVAKAMCQMHYLREYRHGDVHHTRYPDFPERFEQRVERTATCWNWTGSMFNHGYGEFWDGKHNRGAHRYGYELWVGPIPDGLQLDHLCKNPRCVNPAHLEPVTAQVNIARSGAISTVNRVKTHCLRGHEYAGDNLAIVASTGERRCRTCGRDVMRQRRASERGVAIGQASGGSGTVVTGANPTVGPNDTVTVR